MGGLKLEEGVNAKVNCENGILVGRVAPLKVVVSADEEGGIGEALVYSQKGPIVGAVDETIARAIDL